MAERRLAYLSLEAPRVGQASHVHVSEIIAGLERRGWSVLLYRPSYTDRVVKPGTLRRLLEYALVQLRMWVGRRRGTAIYIRAHPMAFPTALSAFLFRVPLVQEVNGTYEDIFVTYPWLMPFRRLLEALQRRQYRWADHLLPVTRELADWLRREAGHGRITVIPNGANTILFRPQAPRPVEAPEAPYAVFFGGLARWHGVETMLAAVAHADWPAGVVLTVIGDGREGPRVREAAARNPAVVFAGYRPYAEVPGWVAGALCGLVPISDPGGRSRTGLYPLKLFETLACGIPVVVTDFPGQADLVRDHGCGLVIPADDPASLARAVARLSADPETARGMGERGRCAVVGAHSWDARAGQTHEVLLRLCRSGLEKDAA